MTLAELFAASVNGFPIVKSLNPVPYATSNIGRVSVIKDTKSHKGCAVDFPGIKYSMWYYEETGTDKRMKYMSDLVLVNEPPPLNRSDEFNRRVYGSFWADGKLQRNNNFGTCENCGNQYPANHPHDCGK